MVAAYNEPPYRYAHITASGATTLKTSPGVLHSIVVNTPGTSNNITVSDGANTVAVLAAGTVAQNYIYDIGYGTSLIINPSATCDITVNYS
jgi:hypothetical protein